ncbi:hypothetical protein BSL78_07034 [Apostichopus japonicus]|uniref:Uncharacterized protein n=1 Tax=Stichopus japonicus TaxID=307972 RepID=A0A2G8L710_STIJA|nr:hypothetical protein BSL78_07034 [Apostichopus japonicus]
MVKMHHGQMPMQETRGRLHEPLPSKSRLQQSNEDDHSDDDETSDVDSRTHELVDRPMVDRPTNWLTDHGRSQPTYEEDQSHPRRPQLNCLGLSKEDKVPTGKFIQFVHIGGNHWITISNVHSKTPDQLTVYDFLHGGRLSTSAQQIIARYVKTTKDRLSIDLATCSNKKTPTIADRSPHIAFGVSLA